MDRYFRSPAKLAKALEVVIESPRQITTPEIFEIEMPKGTQCQMETKLGDVYRGQVKCVRVSKNERKIIVILDWMCIKRSIFDKTEILRDRWFLVPQPPSGSHFFDIQYNVAYIQKDEQRVKVKGSGENCRFYREDDHTTLVKCEDEYISYYNLHKNQFEMALLITLLNQ